MNLIEVTIEKTNAKILLNVDMIGSLDSIDKDNPNSATDIGHLTHNNGGFKVKETLKVVLDKIRKSTELNIG